MASRHTAHWVPAPTLANTASVTFKMGNFASSSLEAGGVPRGGLLISCRQSEENVSFSPQQQVVSFRGRNARGTRVILQFNRSFSRELVVLHTKPSMFGKFSVHAWRQAWKFEWRIFYSGHWQPEWTYIERSSFWHQEMQWTNTEKVFIRTSTPAPSMHWKLTEYGKYCMQNNQLTSKTSVGLKDNSTVHIMKSTFPSKIDVELVCKERIVILCWLTFSIVSNHSSSSGMSHIVPKSFFTLLFHLASAE